MGLSASQGRMLLLTARKSDLEYRAQQISQKRLVLSQQLESISTEYEEATSNRQMKITLWQDGVATSSDDAARRTTNLTYAALVSGTVRSVNPNDSGIQGYDRTEGQDYTSSTFYRLVDADGAIVVSSEDEIPANARTTSSTITTTDALDSKDGATDGIYKVGTYDSEGGFTQSGASYIALSDIPNYKNTALYKALYEDKNSSDTSKTDLEVDVTNGMIKIVSKDDEGKEETRYFNYKTGEEDTKNNKFKNCELKANVVENSSEVPASTRETISSGDTIKSGGDNKYTLYDKNGTVIARYVVDPALAMGTSDVNGTTDGPNYLQDCIRNGKYLIQKGEKDTDDGDKFKWKNLSWDCAANIQDSYYQDDDDKAKAKYDRLQGQIQAQDKKLDLELDNIQTQRSAVTSEEESVKKVIDENIEGSFNAFA